VRPPSLPASLFCCLACAAPAGGKSEAKQQAEQSARAAHAPRPPAWAACNSCWLPASKSKSAAFQKRPKEHPLFCSSWPQGRIKQADGRDGLLLPVRRLCCVAHYSAG
jgi:hypothetical protein